MLRTEKNTRAMERTVLTTARKNLRKRGLVAFFEHGQWWVEHLPSGAQWSVCDAVIGGIETFDFEQVTSGE